MTREEFDKRIEFSSRDGEDGNLVIEAEFLATSAMTISRHYRDEKHVVDDTRKVLKDCLWHSIYGDNRMKFVEKLIALRSISFSFDLKECDRIYNEIYELLKGL